MVHGFLKETHYKEGTKEIPKRDIVEKNTTNAIKKYFKPEFLNRINKIIIFNFLTKENYIKIAQIELSILAEKLNKKGISFKYTDNVIDALINNRNRCGKRS